MDAADPALRRVHVVGTSGSGKTELARRLSGILGAPHVELDDLHWLPGWRERPRDEFREIVAGIVAQERWIIAGNYETRAQDLTFPRATAIVWLDYGFALTFRRAVKRTFRRLVNGDTCCNGNRETIRRALFSRNSILLWVIQTHGRKRRDYPARLAGPECAHLRVFVFRTPAQTEAWVAGLATCK